MRALETLKAADVILCEDTRVTGKLLAHYEIGGKELVRADAEKEASAAALAAAQLVEGKHVTYVSDAGTPGVSDPGGRLVAHVRDEVPNVRIEVIPGASSVTAALAISGLDTTAFTFLGFVPHKKGRQTFFERLPTFEHPVIFFESTHRILKTLEVLAELEADYRTVNRTITIRVARELTKLHEEMLIGSPSELLEQLTTEPVKQKGEFVIIFEAA